MLHIHHLSFLINVLKWRTKTQTVFHGYTRLLRRLPVLDLKPIELNLTRSNICCMQHITRLALINFFSILFKVPTTLKENLCTKKLNFRIIICYKPMRGSYQMGFAKMVVNIGTPQFFLKKLENSLKLELMFTN